MHAHVRPALAIFLLLVACEPTPAPAPVAAPAPEPEVAAAPSPWVVPVDVNNASSPSQADFYDLGWQSLVALSWPALAPSASQGGGAPDTTLSLGASAGGATVPAVWSTWRDLDGIMLAGATDPGAWGAVLETPPAACQPVGAAPVAPGFQPMVLDDESKASDTIKNAEGGVNEATENPLIDQLGRYVFYDIRMNESEYTYIQTNQYYNGAAQSAAVAAGTFAPFPKTGAEATFNPPLPAYAQFGATEIKASWRVLDPEKDIFSRYYTQTGYFVQPSGACEGPVTFGLVGLHILRLTPTTGSTWYWATFEQVDNTEITGTAPTRPDGSALTPSFSTPGTPNGACTDAYNKAPAQITGDVPWGAGNTPVNVCRATLIPSDIAAINAKWQATAPVAGTVWQNYQLVGTINPATSDDPSPIALPTGDTSAKVNTNALANVTMETYSQAVTTDPNTTSNCVNCHAFGAPQGAPNPLPGSLQIFTFLLGDADSVAAATPK